MSNARISAFLLLLLGASLLPRIDVLTQEIIGLHVTPHQFSSELRWRRPPEPELSAKVELFLKNDRPEALPLPRDGSIHFDGKSARELLAGGSWVWHDTPSSWLTEEEKLPPDRLTVLAFNGKSAAWGVGTRHELRLGDSKLEFELARPRAWLSAVTFLPAGDTAEGPESIYPERIIVHVVNEAETELQIESLHLWLPEPGKSHHVLRRARTLDRLEGFPASLRLAPGSRGGFSVQTEPLPLTRAAIELRVKRPDQPASSLWAALRIKKEVFDISGGWVASDVGGRSSLLIDEYRRTLARLHINTGQIQEVAGFTDRPEEYAKLPLKRFNRLWPPSRYDTEAMIPTIHAVEFLGEPQYGGGRPVPPQEVWEKLAPYQPGRLATSLTLSEERTWRYYAGLSDYPHYDAYRVTAPAADSWRSYDRWDGQKIRWGSPLETIGTMTRSLRELSRPRPIAYWSQGAHHGWGGPFNPRRSSPNPDELRSQAWHGLANRITSLYWFNLSLKSIVKFPDLIEPITQVNREVRLLDDLFLEGDAFEHRRLERDGKPSWDLDSIATRDTALLVVHDLEYRADPEIREFRFEPREARVTFRRPSWLTGELSIFEVSHAGTREVLHSVTDATIEIGDTVRVVGIYVATQDKDHRERLDRRHRELVEKEKRSGFDPGGNPEDLERLKAFLEKP